MDPLLLTDGARYAHILSVAIGLGVSFLADFYVISRLNRPIDREFVHTLQRCHSLVAAALLGMWITGLWLIQIRTGFELANFTPKLFSKLFIVTVLTLNAILIGHLAMPVLTRSMGQAPIALPFRRKIPMAMVAGVSTASWLLALAMGVSKTLAASDWIVFIEAVPAVYIASLTGALAVVMFSGRFAEPRNMSGTPSAA